MGEEEGLTAFQVEVAQLFFSLPEAADFLVAGGAALIAQGLVHRTTEDLDFFCGPTPSISDTADAFEAAAAARGWTGSEWSCLDSLWQKESGGCVQETLCENLALTENTER